MRPKNINFTENLVHTSITTTRSKQKGKMFTYGNIYRAVPWFSRQLERLNNMPVMGSILGSTLGPSLESLYRPACPRRTLRQIEEDMLSYNNIT